MANYSVLLRDHDQSVLETYALEAGSDGEANDLAQIWLLSSRACATAVLHRDGVALAELRK